MIPEKFRADELTPDQISMIECLLSNPVKPVELKQLCEYTCEFSDPEKAMADAIDLVQRGYLQGNDRVAQVTKKAQEYYDFWDTYVEPIN